MIKKILFGPELLSELEYYYNDILNFIDNDEKILNIYGDIGCGKSTLTKLYLNKRNINYTLFEDYNLSINSINNFFNQLTEVNILSYFNNFGKQLIVIDNYDYFLFNFSDILKDLNFKFIIISNKLHFKKNCIYVINPSRIYLEGLYNSIINCDQTIKPKSINFNKCDNFLKFYNLVYNFESTFDEFIYNKNIIKKIHEQKNLILDNYDINDIHVNYLNYCYDIDTVCQCASILHDSLQFINTDYYQIINNFLIINLSKPIDHIEKYKLNYHKKNKIILECKKNICSPLELSYIKIIKNKK